MSDKPKKLTKPDPSGPKVTKEQLNAMGDIAKSVFDHADRKAGIKREPRIMR